MSFALDEPPTLPQKGYSGSMIKIAIVRAMQEQLDAEKAAFQALDRMITLLTGDALSVAPPPRGNTYHGSLVR